MFGAGSGPRVVQPWYISYWPNLKHTYTQYTHTRMHARTHIHTYTHRRTHTYTNAHACGTHRHTLTDAQTRTRVWQTHTRARTHCLTHTPKFQPPDCVETTVGPTLISFNRLDHN